MMITTVLQGVLAVLALLATIYGFYTGFLPRWIRGVIGFNELKADVESVKQDTHQLRIDHEETLQEIETLKAGQVDIAETVANEHNGVNVDKLRERHFGPEEADVPGDFLRDIGDD